MSAQPNKHWTPEEYLAFERASEEKHEYLAGEVYLMTGASRAHNLIVVNLAAILGNQLKSRDCEAYVNDMRVRISALRSYTYPDVVVVCGEAKFEDNEFDTLLNPTVIIEVLSPSTEIYDRGKKFQLYRTLDSLQEYVLISQDAPRIEHFARQESGQWLLSEVTDLQAQLILPAVGCTLALEDVYNKVTFEAE